MTSVGPLGTGMSGALAQSNGRRGTIDVALMVEGQNGLNWARWQCLARAAEDLGFAGLYRSDHLANPQLPNLEALELWVSLTWLASHTRRIQFGPLVSPVSFRHPVITAWMAAAVDDLSGGRLQLGLGTGWTEREHAMYGFDLLPVQRRFTRLQEALEVITRLLRCREPTSFSGEFYRLEGAALLPKPHRRNGPAIVVGGNGTRRALPLVAAYADEWNALYLTGARFAELNARVDSLLEERGRRPNEVRRSLMTGLVFGVDDAAVRAKREGRTTTELQDRGMVFGTPPAVVDQLGHLAELGVQRVMLQWLELDDLAGLEALAVKVLPQL